MTTSKSKRRRAAEDGPSAASLREIPELSPDARSFGRGQRGLANALAFFAVMRGRPRKGTTAAGSSVRSLRLPDAAWAELERRADGLEIPLHKLLRRIVAEFLYTEPAKARAGGKPSASKRRPRRAAARRPRHTAE